MKKSCFMSPAVLFSCSVGLLGCGAGASDVPPDANPGRDASFGDEVTETAEAGDDGGDDGGPDGPTFVWNGTGGDGGPCRPNFLSGLNVAWIHFARDVPGPDLGAFRSLFRNTYNAGGRVARWWFHTNAQATPRYDSDGLAMPLTQSNIDDVKSILDTASGEHMMVVISLWSFDMLKSNTNITNNMKLLTVDANRQAYIDNVLTPLVQALAGYPGLYGWETFNEPEGMATGVAPGYRPFTGTSGQSVDVSYIQKTVNAFAGAIHDADPNALVTNGSWQFRANANISGMTNFYSDSALLGVPNAHPKGTLDFYEVHYYANNGVSVSPFANPVSYWMLDKRVVIGEFYALSQDGVSGLDTYTTLFNSGYGGAWAWQYQNNDNTSPLPDGGPPAMTKWPAMQVPIENLYALSPNDVDCP